MKDFFIRIFKNFLTSRTKYSKTINFIDSLRVLLPLFSLSCLFSLVYNFKTLHIESFNELLLVYTFFVLIAPLFVSTTYSFAFSGIIEILKKDISDDSNNTNVNKIPFDCNKPCLNSSNELRLTQIFKK